MKVFTIGFKGRSAKNFFQTLKEAGVQKLIDVRRKNASQLAGFTKGPDLEFFLEECFGIAYEHISEFAPSENLLRQYRDLVGKKKPDNSAWDYYTERFGREVLSPRIIDRFEQATDGFENVCFLCSEKTADHCHRRLLAEYILGNLSNVKIKHL